ncbi:MAG: hypothetical protein WAL80_15415 [Xanthobacteraceae bacterium]|jgi:hypothetical protein
MSEIDPHDEIERLEAKIEDLAARVENCRKFMLASRIAITGGAVVLAALLFGVIRFDPTMMAGAAAALLGGIVLFGSNSSTAKEAAEELAATEAARADLIAQLDLHLVAERPTLH